MRIPELMNVMLGAALGGGLRYAISTAVTGRTPQTFPWHTFGINVSGAFLLGALLGAAAGRSALGSPWVLFLGVGVLGGFTTFSTLSYESVSLIERGLIAQGAGYVFGSLMLGLVAAAAGLAVGRAL